MRQPCLGLGSLPKLLSWREVGVVQRLATRGICGQALSP